MQMDNKMLNDLHSLNAEELKIIRIFNETESTLELHPSVLYIMFKYYYGTVGVMNYEDFVKLLDNLCSKRFLYTRVLFDKKYYMICF